jgi:hypothetical protein
MDALSIWPGTEYLFIPERGKGETLNYYNFPRCKRVKVWYKVKAGYYGQPNRRDTTIVEVSLLDPITGAEISPHTKNIRARHIVCRWEEVAEQYAELKAQRTQEQIDTERRLAEQRERDRQRREEWEARKEVERQAKLEADRKRAERLSTLKRFLMSNPIDERWIYSTSDHIMTIDLNKVEAAMQEEEEKGATVIDFPQQSS